MTRRIRTATDIDAVSPLRVSQALTMSQPKILGNVVTGSATIRAILVAALHLVMRTAGRVTITGKENIPPSGPLVVIINHIAFWDPVIVIGAVDRLLVPMAKAEAFEVALARWFMWTTGTIPVHRGEADTAAVKRALQVLKLNGGLLMAPEGTRSLDYQMQPARDGAAMLALRANATILPIGLTGSHQIKAHWTSFRRVPITISIGEPFQLQVSSRNRKELKAVMPFLTEQMMYRVAALLPTEFRGVYSNLNAINDNYFVPVKPAVRRKL